MDTPVAQWELALRPWRTASSAIALVQLSVFVAGFVFLARSEVHRAVIAAVAYGLLEGLKWTVETVALRANPEADFEPFYRAAPLPPAQRTFLKVSLLAMPVEVVALGLALASSLDLALGTTALFLGVLVVSWTVPLERVRRRGSWLAMTRLPSRPRRIPDPAVKEPSPATPDERTRGRKLLRWFLIVLLPFVIVAVLFLVLALLTRNDGNAQERRLVSSYVVEPPQVEWPDAARRFLRQTIAKQGGTLQHLSCGGPAGGETSCRVRWRDANGFSCDVSWPLKVTSARVQTARDFITVCTSTGGYRPLP